MSRFTEPTLAKERLAWPGTAALVLCYAILAVLIALAVRQCGGHFGYPMDDTYIHMAMAKNFSLHGVWGTTRYAFTSSTSSPFYTLLLAACYRVTGVREITPLILNLISGLALLSWSDFVLARAGLQRRPRLLILVGLVMATPLPILILGGMEHTLHALLTLVFVHLCCISLASPGGNSRGPDYLWVLCAVLVMTRYEGLFVIAAAGVLFLARGNWKKAIGLALGCGLPVFVYGAISMSHGWLPLPTSLLLKANVPSAAWSGIYPGFLTALFHNLSRGSHVVALVVIAGGLLYRVYRLKNTVWTYSSVGLILFGATAILHLTLARTGWFFRYEAYLVVLGGIATAIAFWDVGIPAPRKLWIAALVILTCLLTARTGYAFYVAPQAISDIYDQQYQMGLFAQQNLNGKTVLLHDIGAVSFLSDAKVLDLVGLGSLESAMARMKHEYSDAWLHRWIEETHASVAIVYPFVAPRDWQRVATWRIPGNYMSGSDSVGFYALDPVFQKELTGDLDRFRAQLPSRVVVQ